MKIAITGNTGFIGSGLMNLFSKNKSITVFPFDKNKYSLSSTPSLKNFVKNKDVIIHLAGISNTKFSDNYFPVNTLGTFHLLEAIALYANPNTKFVFSSSLAVYEEVSRKEKLSEDNTETIPRNWYGLSKLFAEEFVKFYNRKKNIPVRILRISNAYGPGNKNPYNGIISILIDKIQNEKPVIIDGDGTQSRDFIFIDDILHAFTNILSYQGQSLLVNICSGTEIKILDLVKKIELLLKKKAIIQFNRDYSETGYWIGNPRKALEEIAFSSETDLDQGLQQTITWYLHKRNL